MLDRLLEDARAGRSGVLVVRGEAGIGKTALLDHAVDAASDLTVLRAAGMESERELAFAALEQFCAPLLDRLDRLPAPQREALRTTFGLAEGAVPDRLLVGLATLGLLSEAADERPLLCVIDDAQWLDRASAQALGFVARRLLAESALMLFAAREPNDLLTGLPELVVERLSDDDARFQFDHAPRRCEPAAGSARPRERPRDPDDGVAVDREPDARRWAGAHAGPGGELTGSMASHEPGAPDCYFSNAWPPGVTTHHGAPKPLLPWPVVCPARVSPANVYSGWPA